MKNLIRCLRIHFALLLFSSLATLNAQTEPDPEILKVLSFLDNTAFNGDNKYKDSAGKAQVDFAVRVCRQYLNTELDSLSRSLFLYHKGKLEYIRQHYDTAFASYQEALNLNISNYPALEAFSALSQERFPEFQNLWAYINASINLWKIRCSLDSNTAFQWFYLAKTYELQTRYTKVIKQFEIADAYRKCIALEPDNPHFYYSYSCQVSCKEKIPLLKKALQLEESPIYRTDILQCYLDLKQYEALHRMADQSIQSYSLQIPVEHKALAAFYRLKAEAYKRQKNNAARQNCLIKLKFHTERQSATAK